MSEIFFKQEELRQFNNDGIIAADLKRVVDVIPLKIKEYFLSKRNQIDIDFYDVFTLLKYIYIVRNIREYGLLVRDCYDYLKNAVEYVKILFECDLIETSKTTRSFKNLEIIDLTEFGEIVSSALTKIYIEKLNFKEIRSNFGDFLLNYIYHNKITYLEAKFRYYPGPEIDTSFAVISYDNRLNPLHEWSKVFYSKLFELFSYLMEKHICYKATNYAGTRGGERRQPYYLIPNEFVQFFGGFKNELYYGDFKRKINDFEYEVSNLILMYDFFKAYNEENYHFKSYSKKVLNLICSQIEELKAKEAISLNRKYIKNRDLYSPPFKIIDEIRYENIIKDLFSEIIENANEKIISLLNLKITGEPVTPTKRTKEILVFISYATRDAEIFKIRDIAEYLTAYSDIVDVLFWQEDSKDNIITYMNENLSKCDIMLLFCTPNALKSIPVEKEWTAADAMNKPIIPVFLEDDHIPPLLKPRMGLKFNLFEFQKNIDNLYKLIIKKTTNK
ncbi:MAG: toll/interleukin-1 receptor domain-containing protein [Candidatus Lokiarchaeia archaeon]